MVIGEISSGKTTFLSEAIKKKQSSSSDAAFWTILSNDTGNNKTPLGGSASIDPLLTIKIQAGACLCCESPAVTEATIAQLIRHSQPDLFLFEVSALANIPVLVNLLEEGNLSLALSIKGIICMIDLTTFSEGMPRLKSRITAANIIVGTKADLVTGERIAEFKEWLRNEHPSKDFSLSYNGETDCSVTDYL